MIKILPAKSAYIFLTRWWACKIYYGIGGKELILREKNGQNLALTNKVWAEFVLKNIYYGWKYVVSPSHAVVNLDDLEKIEKIEKLVLSIISRSVDCLIIAPVSAVVDIKYFKFLGLNESIYNSVFFRLNSMADFLPIGPAHNDLHIGNILIGNDGIFRIIDFDRFTLLGCPLFDGVHFRLNLLQQKINKPWIDVLLSDELNVNEFAGNYVDPLSLKFLYALNRINYELSASLIMGRSLDKYTRQVALVMNKFT